MSKTGRVFLDTDVLVRAGNTFSAPLIKALVALVDKGRVSIVLTDLTVREMRAKLVEAVERCQQSCGHSLK